jgi:hypothetical protein
MALPIAYSFSSILYGIYLSSSMPEEISDGHNIDILLPIVFFGSVVVEDVSSVLLVGSIWSRFKWFWQSGGSRSG